MQLRTWRGGKLTLSDGHPAWQLADRLALEMADLSAEHDRLTAEATAVDIFEDREQWQALADQANPLRRQLSERVNAAVQPFIDLLPELHSDSHRAAYVEIASSLPENPDWTDPALLALRFRAILHDAAAKGLVSSMSSGIGTGRRYEIEAKYKHPLQAEIDAWKQAKKDKAEATREAKRQAEALIAEVYRESKAIEAAIKRPPPPVGTPVVVVTHNWHGRPALQYVGEITEIIGGIWIKTSGDGTGRPAYYHDGNRFTADQILPLDLTLAEAPETICCSNCGTEHPVSDAGGYRCQDVNPEARCGLPPQGYLTREYLKIQACVEAMIEQMAQAMSQAA